MFGFLLVDEIADMIDVWLGYQLDDEIADKLDDEIADMLDDLLDALVGCHRRTKPCLNTDS